MTKGILILLFVLLLSSCTTTISGPFLSPLPAPAVMEDITHMDAHVLYGAGRVVSVTCFGRQAVIREQHAYKITVGCVGPTPTPTPTPTATPTETPVPTSTPVLTSSVRVTTFVPALDTYIAMTTPDNAFGNAATLAQDGNPTARTSSLLRFDLSSLPSNTGVVSATLTLVAARDGRADRTITLSALSAANGQWDSSATWNHPTATTDWAGASGATVAGVDYNAAPLGQLDWLASNIANTAYVVSLDAAQVQGWIDGANAGLMLHRLSADGMQTTFHSANASNPQLRPQLTIWYVE